MSLVTSNNVQKIIALPVVPADLTITLVDVTGLPDVSAPADWTILTLIRLSDSQQEIVRVDSITGNVLTVQRAQEGTTALSFAASDEARNFFTSGMFDQFTFEADTAVASAAAALVSENNAATSETNAGTSETNAATSETNAGTSETNAATSASNASTSETNAGTSETNAATSASNASTSETNAAASETKAADWAEELEDVPVETGPDRFSAFHWAKKAEAFIPSGSGFPSTDSDKTAAYTVVSGDVGNNIVFSGLSANVDCTLDVSLLSLGEQLGIINEDPTYSVRVIVSNTGTMTIATGTSIYLWEQETVLLGGNTATNARILARP